MTFTPPRPPITLVGWSLLAGVAVAASFACAAGARSSPQIHQVAGGAEDVFANAYIIEGESGLVVVDALLTRRGAGALRQRRGSLHKPVLAIVITHGHPDHYGGVAQIVEELPATPVVALAGVDTVIRRDDAIKGARLRALGIDWAEPRVFPNVIALGSVEFRFGDISLTPIGVGEAESDHDSVWVLRTATGKHAFVGDLVMNDVHAYTADAHTARWLDALARVQTRLANAIRIYPGHGHPGGIDLLPTQTRYIEAFRAEVQKLAAGRPSLSAEQVRELETRMVRLLGHDRMARWIGEGANPVAREINESASAVR